MSVAAFGYQSPVKDDRKSHSVWDSPYFSMRGFFLANLLLNALGMKRINLISFIFLVASSPGFSLAEDCDDFRIYMDKLRHELAAKPAELESHRQAIHNLQADRSGRIATELRRAKETLDYFRRSRKWAKQAYYYLHQVSNLLESISTNSSTMEAIQVELKNGSPTSLASLFKNALTHLKSRWFASRQAVKDLNDLVSLLEQQERGQNDLLNALASMIPSSDTAIVDEMIWKVRSLKIEYRRLSFRSYSELRKLSSEIRRFEDQHTQSLKNEENFNNLIQQVENRTTVVQSAIQEWTRKVEHCDFLARELMRDQHENARGLK